ncbi:NUDIX hydrolase [Neolewinella litorea]|uniref:NUDIX domain-containing protein n=1 Tax=Neolewinella litorea TaxID=2562452 RepID=A0A4S4NC63_9BACT|nr:NUDIX domain-containing protein [Neolewinella litorea]THH36305.1 NUDIX domain-containing protein [Neolewinella litorea]
MPDSARPLPPAEDYLRQLSIDCVIFGYRDGKLFALVPKLVFEGDFWALPGGFIRQEEDIDAAARRILETRTGITNIYLEQFRVFGAAERTNRYLIEHLAALPADGPKGAEWIRANADWLAGRFVSIGYYALVDMRKVMPARTEIDASVDWYPVNELPPMIMDHNDIVAHARRTLQRYLDEKLIGYNLLPEKFTMKDLRYLYEAVYDRPFARNNFQKKILDLNVLERLEKKYSGGSHRAPYLYRFIRR